VCFQSGNDLVGSVPEELCALNLAVLEVDCDEVECDCCQSCSGIIIYPPGTAPTDDPLYQKLTSVSPDNGQALEDTSSPQFAAYSWLSSQTNSEFSSDQRLFQRYALATFYYSTAGDGWITSSSWLTDTDECGWFTTQTDLPICDDDSNYVALVLQDNDLGGSLPLELLLLADTLGELKNGDAARDRRDAMKCSF
jgi:hypothetical protein